MHILQTLGTRVYSVGISLIVGTLRLGPFVFRSGRKGGSSMVVLQFRFYKYKSVYFQLSPDLPVGWGERWHEHFVGTYCSR